MPCAEYANLKRWRQAHPSRFDLEPRPLDFAFAEEDFFRALELVRRYEHVGVAPCWSNIPRLEVAYDSLGRSDTDLDVIQFAQAGAGIEFVSLHEETSNCLKWLKLLLFAE